MLALVAAGASLIHFIEAWWALPGGVVLLASGPLLFGFGVWRYRRVNRDLRRVRESLRTQGNRKEPSCERRRLLMIRIKK